MKTLSILPILFAGLLSAAPVDLTNTAGTTINAEIKGVQDGKVTIARTSDGQSFTIPLTMLDAPSIELVNVWEQEAVYFPDTRPFITVNGETIIPIRIEGTELTYLNSAGQELTKKFDVAPKLQKLADANLSAIGRTNKGAFNQPDLVDSINLGKPASQFLFDDRMAFIDDASRDISAAPRIDAFLNNAKGYL